MGWFDGNEIDINLNATLNEGKYISWGFGLQESRLIRLSVNRLDGYGVNVYIMSSEEYRHFTQNLMFNVFTDLSFENIESFSNEAWLQKGSYYLVAKLPEHPDGLDSYGKFGIRCEVVK